MSPSSGTLPESALNGFHRNTNTVRVDNVSKTSTGEVIALFNALVGQICNFQEIKDALGTHLEITFFNCDSATKALCMTGYNIGGGFLAVTPIVSTVPNTRIRPSDDGRRNLYVLGLPFALTKNEFAALFSRYGTVSHCVILATVDNSSRRRGFIVMSTHEEAKLAMSALTRSQIKGHTIDVSWAVVQRSQGFLDGGDRSTLLDSRSPTGPILSNESDSRYTQDPSEIVFDPMDSDLSSYTASLDPTSTLFVSKLPALLFSQTQDLEPLFYPYGMLKKLQIAGLGLNGTLSVLVQYHTVTSAQEAKEALHGQNYINCQIDVQFLRLVIGPFEQGQTLGMPSSFDKGDRFGLRSSTTMATPRISRPLSRPLESYNSPGTSDTSNFNKRSFFVTPSFNSAFCDRRGTEFNQTSARWSTDITAPAHSTISQHTRVINDFSPSNQSQNLLV